MALLRWRVACLLQAAWAIHVTDLAEECAGSQHTSLLQTRARAEAPREPAPPVADDSLFVLDVTAPRSGTQSMYTALKMLGLNPLHTGYNRTLKPIWYDYLFRNGSLDEALKTLQGHRAAMDCPLHLLYKEIMRAYPGAKFVLHPVHSTPQGWYNSVVKLTRNVNCINASVEGLDEYVPSGEVREGPVIDRRAKLPSRASQWGIYGGDRFWYWNCHFNQARQSSEDIQSCLDMYLAHEQAARREIPAEKLLILDMKQGWGPLCDFLGLPVPNEPFPHIDEYNEPAAYCSLFKTALAA